MLSGNERFFESQDCPIRNNVENKVFSRIANDKVFSDYAFYDCSSLKNITIPNNVTTIGSSTFSYCSSLVNITIPNNVTTIQSAMFFSCYRLETVIIGESVNEIEAYAFQYCSNLLCIYFYGVSAPTVYSSAFSSIPAKTVMTTSAYQSAVFGSLNVST